MVEQVGFELCDSFALAILVIFVHENCIFSFLADNEPGVDWFKLFDDDVPSCYYFDHGDEKEESSEHHDHDDVGGAEAVPNWIIEWLDCPNEAHCENTDKQDVSGHDEYIVPQFCVANQGHDIDGVDDLEDEYDESAEIGLREKCSERNDYYSTKE